MNGTWSERGSAAVDAGDLDTAKLCFSRAVKADERNPAHRFHLAVVQEGLGEFADAANQLTQALRIDAKHHDAARRLAALQRRVDMRLFDGIELNPIGLRHALQHDRVERQAIANVAVRYLSSRPPLQDALAMGASQGWLEAARSLCLEKSSPLLKDDLFLDVLRKTLPCNAPLEMLLTAVRRVLLLELAPQRFADAALLAFTVALLQQCWTNEFVWVVSDEETRALADASVDPGSLAGGDLEQGQRLLRQCLYQPVAQVLGAQVDAKTINDIQPRLLRDAVTQRLALEQDERDRGARIPLLGSIDDETSRKVAQFYERSPYPRWSSVSFERDFPASVARFLGRDRTAFMQRPFEMLIAGCGTGQHAVQAAIHYGPNARILALDLSAASLGYAARMVEKFGVENVEFARADLAQLDSFGPELASRFQIIEAVGVLHHMADPFASWKSLLSCLAPGGLMRVGLYSAKARQHLTSLRSDPAYPGPGCTDEALRAFRQDVLARQNDQGREARNFVDFWDTSSFRDLLLHVSEHNLTVEEIARFLKTERLEFLGFLLTKEKQAPFWKRYPQDPWPGSLEHWAQVEADIPWLFQNMYQFWCTRA